MRVERQGKFIHIAIKNGNQERWFNIEEGEAQELALKLGEVLSEPKKPKFNVGDRVRVLKDSFTRSYTQVGVIGEILTIEEGPLPGGDYYVIENNWIWAEDWLELVEPLKFNVGDRVRVIENVWDKDTNLKGQEFTIKALKPFNAVVMFDNYCIFDLSWLEKVEG